MPTSCPICERRRSKRFCPGLSRSRWAAKTETICAPCCGEQREATIDCPADCPYLVAAHRYEAGSQRRSSRFRSGQARPTAKELAFPDVVITEDFLEEKQLLLGGVSLFVVRFAREHPEVRDPELLGALDALARGYLTLESGLYYEQPPDGVAAKALYAALQGYLNQYAQEQQQRAGTSPRPGEVLRALVFLRRLGQGEANGRPLSRRYLEFLRAQFPSEAAAPSDSRLIIPGR